MATTITHSTGTIVPAVVNGYEASREAKTIVHGVLNRSNPDVTFRAPGLRVGQLRCIIATQADAITAFGILSLPQVFAITDPDTPAIGMSFVVAGGDLTIELDDETQSVWIITVPFAEVLP